MVSVGKSIGLDTKGADTEECAENHKEDLTTDELSELHSESRRIPLRNKTGRRRAAML